MFKRKISHLNFLYIVIMIFYSCNVFKKNTRWSTYLFRLQNSNGIKGSSTTMENSKAQFSWHFCGGCSRASQFFLCSSTKFFFDLQYKRAKSKHRFDHSVITHHVYWYISWSFKACKSVKCGSCFWLFGFLCLENEKKIIFNNIINS